MSSSAPEERVSVNGYAVDVIAGERGLEVCILDRQGSTVFSRACGSEDEARDFASTVRQHISWLSPEKFREYYRLPARR